MAIDNKQIQPDYTVSPAWRVLVVALFAGTIFTGAFLLFQVQPLIGRFLLPWFGGSPEVWTTCMMFFQLFLLAGYAYAHLNIQCFTPKQQARNQILLLIIAAVTLSIIPPDSVKPSPGDNPVLKILLICSVCVGLPYFLLSTTGPLLQAWFTRLLPGAVPYRLYALSNAGSLLALLSFPFVFEPHFTRQTIAGFWSIGFFIYTGFGAAAAMMVWKKYSPQNTPLPVKDTSPAACLNKGLFLLWIALPACASIELLAVTEKLTEDIAVIPFLWIAPLSLYLLSFIICFDHSRWYFRPAFLTLFILSIAGIIFARQYEDCIGLAGQFGFYLGMLFCCCMVCHGELYRLRPNTKYLTQYYLSIAAGGAIGGIFVAVVAPAVFRVRHELHLGLLITAAVVLMAQQNLTPRQIKRRPLWTALLIIVGIAGIILQGEKTNTFQSAICHARNFFGVLTVWEESPDNPDEHQYLLQHGTTYHGLQFQAPEKRHLATSYYSPNSGIGMLLENMPKQKDRKIGVVGLGVGTIAAYGKPGDRICFYEINPEVQRLALKYFTYLSECSADVKVIPGDARLTLDSQTTQNFDVLVVDAFSSDAVPIHLLTKEAFEIYLRHLAPDGVLAFHISTRHLDLHSVVWKAAEELNLSNIWIEADEDPQIGALATDWILLSRDKNNLNIPILKTSQSRGETNFSRIDLLTDDHINLLQILKFKKPK